MYPKFPCVLFCKLDSYELQEEHNTLERVIYTLCMLLLHNGVQYDSPPPSHTCMELLNPWLSTSAFNAPEFPLAHNVWWITFAVRLLNSHVILLGLSDSAFFTITIVAKAIFMIFDSITIVHFSLINETVIP